MNIWKTCIKSGNEHFRNEDYDLAEVAYIHACERVEKLFSYWLDAEEIVAATTISYFNLADCLKCQGRYKAAQKVLEKAHQLITVSLSEARVGSDRYLALLQGRSKTCMELQQIVGVIGGPRGGAVNHFGIRC